MFGWSPQPCVRLHAEAPPLNASPLTVWTMENLLFGVGVVVVAAVGGGGAGGKRWILKQQWHRRTTSYPSIHFSLPSSAIVWMAVVAKACVWRVYDERLRDFCRLTNDVTFAQESVEDDATSIRSTQTQGGILVSYRLFRMWKYEKLFILSARRRRFMRVLCDASVFFYA